MFLRGIEKDQWHEMGRFFTSTVFPFIALNTSPGFVAFPEGMFSASATSTIRCNGNCSRTTASKADNTHAAPPMSPRINAIAWLGLIDMPPLLKP